MNKSHQFKFEAPQNATPPLSFSERHNQKIPSRLNFLVLTFQLFSVFGCFLYLPHANHWSSLLAVTAVFSVIMNGVYASIHEAHHRILFANRQLNDLSGFFLSLLFGAPFHLLRQGHLGHHRRNRSDDEAFDIYFDRDSKLWKFVAWYGILTGLYWVLVVSANFVLIALPWMMNPAKYRWDRTAQVFLQHFNPKSFPLMRAEAIAVILFHAVVIYLLDVTLARYALMYFGFGWSWSSLQYVHHYGAQRDVLYGARNLHIFPLLDRLWMNHNWHLTHHLHPTLPWVYLPELSKREKATSESLLRAYIQMWRGPKHASVSVENRFDGEVSR